MRYILKSIENNTIKTHETDIQKPTTQQIINKKECMQTLDNTNPEVIWKQRKKLKLRNRASTNRCWKMYQNPIKTQTIARKG